MQNLIKRDLITRISDETGLLQKSVSQIINLTLAHLMENLSQGTTVEFRNFGVFEVKIRKPRVGRNPHQPEHPVIIPPRAVVKFTPGKILKSKVLLLGESIPNGVPNADLKVEKEVADQK